MSTDSRADAYRTATTLYSELVGEVGGPKDADPAFEVERIANWLLEGEGGAGADVERDDFHRRWIGLAKEAGKWRARHEALRQDVEQGAHHWSNYYWPDDRAQAAARAAGNDLNAFLVADDARAKSDD